MRFAPLTATTLRSLAMSARPLSWDQVAGRTAPREQPSDDLLPLTLYRDANAWCPFSHRVWFWMEQLELRYATERIHLGGDPREPEKQPTFFDVSPRGTCPALRLGNDVYAAAT